jgi:hypothetical protein
MDLSSSVFGNECEDESLLTQIPIDDAPPLQVDPQNGLIGFHSSFNFAPNHCVSLISRFYSSFVECCYL